MAFSLYDRERILVTGGAGFLGSHLCERLLEKAHYVICLDNFFTGQNRNIFHLMDNKHFEVVRHDLVNPVFLEVDQIYNLACPASPIHYQYNPVKTTKTSVMGAIHMLGLAKRVKAKILQASTSEVYGDPTVHPQNETYWGNVNTIGPRACYDEGKRCAETLFFDYYRQNRVNIRVVRIFNTYGPRMHPNDGRVISNFVVQALKNEPLTVFGDGTQTRSFCYVDDMVTGMIKMMEGPDDFVGPVNLGNPGEFEIKDVAREIITLARSGSTIEFHPTPEDDPRRRRPDIALAKERLGWKPKVGLEEGLKKTIQYFREYLANP
jgi:UDP-glucuronate decarboxylase